VEYTLDLAIATVVIVTWGLVHSLELRTLVKAVQDGGPMAAAVAMADEAQMDLSLKEARAIELGVQLHASQGVVKTLGCTVVCSSIIYFVALRQCCGQWALDVLYKNGQARA
jgi:hypothetical protein